MPVSVDTAPFSVKERLHVYSTAGRSVSDSKLIPGLLLEATQLLYDRAPDLLCPGREGEGEGEGVAVKRNVAGDIMTAVFSVSMAGDLSEGGRADGGITCCVPRPSLAVVPPHFRLRDKSLNISARSYLNTLDKLSNHIYFICRIASKGCNFCKILEETS